MSDPEFLNVDLTITASDSEAEAVQKAVAAVKSLYAQLVEGMDLDPCGSKGALAGSLLLDMHPECAMKVIEMTKAVLLKRAVVAAKARSEVKH